MKTKVIFLSLFSFLLLGCAHYPHQFTDYNYPEEVVPNAVPTAFGPDADLTSATMISPITSYRH